MFFSRVKAAAGVSVSSQLEDSSSDQSLSNDRLVHRFDSQQGLSSPQVFYERRNDITFKVLGHGLGLVLGSFLALSLLVASAFNCVGGPC